MARQSRPTLLLTRPARASRRLAVEMLALLGPDARIVVSPLMETRLIRASLPDHRPAGLIFTSETAVAGYMALGAQDAQTPGQAICVGPRTADAARQAGFATRIIGGDAEGMVRTLSADPLQGRWLHPRGRDAVGAGHQGTLAQRLGNAGMQIDDIIVYAQEACSLNAEAADLLARGAPVLLPIFSPRSGRIFMSQPQVKELRRDRPDPPIAVAAISEAAASTLGELPPARLAIATTPDGAGMDRAILALWNSTAATPI